MAAAMCCRVEKFSLTCRLFTHCPRYSTAVQPHVEENDIDLYPRIKPKWPEGKWGSMGRRQAWHWYARKQDMARLQSVQKRIEHLTEKDMRMWQFKIFESFPRCLPYQQYATKTHLVKGMPDLYDNVEVDEIVKRIKPAIVDTISLEHEAIYRDKIISKVVPWARKQFHSHIILRNLLSALTTSLSGDCNHLLTSMHDENVRVESFWDRHGYRRRKIPRYQDQEKKKVEFVNDSRLQSCYKADFLIRAEEPLPEFVPRDDELCLSGSYPDMEYNPSTYGQILDRKKKPSVIPGHWPGDPCEFGVLSVNTMNSLYRLAQKYEETSLQQFLIAMGMNISFVRLVAESHYQGFNSLIDLTYPFTTQTILSDGQCFWFFAYQLNTLELWKDNEANPIRNICWHTDEMKLYESVEDGEVKGFNDDVLRQITKFLVLKPGRPGVNLRPSLPADVSMPKDTTSYINEKVEKIVVKKEETYV